MPCPNAEGGYWSSEWVPVGNPPGGHPSELGSGYITSQPVWIPCGSAADASQPGGGSPGSGSGGLSMQDFLNQAKESSEKFTTGFYNEADSPPPPPSPIPPYNPPPSNRPIVKPGSLLYHPPPPCDPIQSGMIVQNSQIPPATGDPNGEYWDPYGSVYNNGTPLYGQAQALQSERILADIAGDYQDSSADGSDLQTAFQNAANAISPSDTPEDVADNIFNALIGQNAAPVSTGELSPALISVLDQMAQEIQDGNGGNIDWSAFQDYLKAQADADAAALQANYLANNPCGGSGVDNALNNQFNNQKAANNALKKLDKNINPPPGGGGTNCDNIDATDPTGDADAIPDLDGQINSLTGKPYPAGTRAAIIKAAKDFNINPLLLYALGMHESGLGTHKLYQADLGLGDFRDGIYHGYGLWQIDIGNLNTDKNGNPLPPLYLTRSMIDRCKFDVNYCAEMSAMLLAYYLQKFGGNVKEAIQAYNGGPGGVGDKNSLDYLKDVCKWLQGADPTGKDAKKGSNSTSKGPSSTPSMISRGPAVGSLLPEVSLSLLGGNVPARASSILPEVSVFV